MRAGPRLSLPIEGQVLDCQLARFTELSELLGPFHIRKRSESEQIANTDRMLPEA